MIIIKKTVWQATNKEHIAERELLGADKETLEQR
jgi:hypothetical protein